MPSPFFLGDNALCGFLIHGIQFDNPYEKGTKDWYEFEKGCQFEK